MTTITNVIPADLIPAVILSVVTLISAILAVI